MNQRAPILLLSGLAVAAVAFAAPAEPPHPFTVHDLVALDRLSEPAISPDGSRVVFTLRTTDLEANRGRTDLWLVGADGGGLRRLTSDPANDGGAVWAPDGRAVYFVSGRSGSDQVWRLQLDGGEANQVTDLPLDVGAIALSPDGRLLAFAADVFPDCADLDCTKQRLDERAASKASGRIWESLPIRHWDTWTDGRRSHLFVVPLAGGAPVDVMKGMDADCPSKPFGGPEEYTFTPDSRALVFSAKDVGREEMWSTNFDLFRAPVDGSAPPTKIVSRPAWDTRPVFSPDGTTMAFLAMARAGYESDRFRIVLRSTATGAERVLTESWDRSPDEISWSRDGRTIYATAQDFGQVALFAIDAATGKVRRLVSKGTNHTPMPARSGRVLYAKASLTSPADLFSVLPDGQGETRLTRLNESRMARVKLGEPLQFDFKGAGGDTVYAYLVKPVDFDPAKKYPLAFLVHGGPQGSMANEFHYRWNPQTYAGHGYATLAIDFHGSTGYGQAFTDAIRDDWGGKPLEDLQKGLAAALARFPWLDGDDVCALGASYGGYMMNWIEGAWPDRFKCIVTHDGNLDEHFAYYQTEELWFPEWEHRGTPWDNLEGYTKHNPERLVAKWQTPMLVIHGARDYRIPDTAGFATFTALQRRGIPSKLLWFPDENHWVLKPANSILWHDTVLAWLDQWLRPKAAATAPTSAGTPAD
jgi:dipeptidyl aminopeptidase/acylaminoacyl peptidase